MGLHGNIQKIKDPLRGTNSHNYNITGQQNLGSNFAVGGNLSGNTSKPPSVTAFAKVFEDNNSVTLSKQHVPGFGSTTTQAANVNLLNSGGHSVNANAFHSQTTLTNGFKFDTQGGGINYANSAGLSAGVGVSQIPNIQSTTNFSASQNLFNAPNASLDFSATAARTCNPAGNCNNSFGGGLSFKGSF